LGNGSCDHVFRLDLANLSADGRGDVPPIRVVDGSTVLFSTVENRRQLPSGSG
jgi:hypothetical protein